MEEALNLVLFLEFKFDLLVFEVIETLLVQDSGADAGMSLGGTGASVAGAGGG